MGLNSRDQAKWDALQSAGESSVDKILAGKGSDADIKALSQVLAQQHALAGEIFDKSIEDAKSTADTYLDQLNKRRVDSGKKPLTQKAHERLFQNSFKQVMAESLEDILAMVHQEFEQHSEKVRDKVGEALEKLQKTVKPLPAGPNAPQERSLFERFAGYVGQRDGFDPRAPAKRSMLDRVLGRNRDPNAPNSSVISTLRDSVKSAKDKVTSLYEKLRGRNRGEDEEKSASIWIRKLRAVFDPVGNAYKKMKAGGSKLKNILGMIGKPLLLALMNPQLIKSITGAVGEYLSFDNISKWVSNMWDDTKTFASDAFDAAMDKVKSFFGGSKDKAKAKAAAPAQTPAAKAMSSSTTPAQAAQALPDLTAKIGVAKQKLETAQKAYAADPSQANKKAVDDAKAQLQVLNVQYTQFAAQARQATTAVEPAVKAQASVSAPAAAGTDTPGPNTVAAPPATMTPPASKPMPQPTTEIIDGMPVYRSGRPVDMKPKEAPPAEKVARADAALSTIGLGSFGFDSNDSSLNILNMGMLA